jgi:hydroxymethylpyrimidine/phosphomethylpyrimidine kinase
MVARRRARLPCALSIAGLDPSGGAGIAADLRGFAAAGAWGCAAAAVLTVQSTAGLVESVPVETGLLEAQIREIFSHHAVRAVKIGALGSLGNVRAVERLLASLARRSVFVVVLDPVLLPSRARPSKSRAGKGRRSNGARLLDARALAALRSLAARATLITPNASEAEALLGREVQNLEQATAAAEALATKGARAVLVKGGHLRGQQAVDVLAVGGRTLTLSGRRVPMADVHGTGCTLSSLIAARLAVRARGVASDAQIVDAVRWAKLRITRGIANAARAGDGSLVIGYEGLVDGSSGGRLR